MSRFAIRTNAVVDLFDEFSPNPLELRPLREDVRDRLLETWIDIRHERPDRLTVELPASERRNGLDARVRDAVRHDFEETYRATSRWRTASRGQRRETRIAFLFMVVSLFLSSLLDKIADPGTLVYGFSQGLIVLGWVALWRPAERMFRAIARRFNRRRYRELAELPIEIAWV